MFNLNSYLKNNENFIKVSLSSKLIKFYATALLYKNSMAFTSRVAKAVLREINKYKLYTDKQTLHAVYNKYLHEPCVKMSALKKYNAAHENFRTNYHM